MNDLDGDGLCEYQHPFSSGLDDSPLWDDGMPVQAPDLNTYLCLQQEALSRIAAALGERDDAALWAQRADDMAQRLIRSAWDKKAGVFWATCNGARVDVLTPFNLFPLITGRMPEHILKRLVRHLTDPAEFGEIVVKNGPQSALVAAGLSTAAMLSRPGLVIGPCGRPVIE